MWRSRWFLNLNIGNRNIFGMKNTILLILTFVFAQLAIAQESFDGRKFEQLGTMLPTPNSYKTASETPEHEY